MTFIFYAISAQFTEHGCRIRTARGTKNFARPVLSSGNRHKFTSMFICASLALPCASVARCRTKFQVPLAVLIMHPYFDEPPRYIPIIKTYHFSQLQKHSLNRFRYKNTLPRNARFGIECFTLKMVEIYFIKKNQNVRIPYAITVYFRFFNFLLLLNRIVVFFHDFLRWFCIYFIIFSLYGSILRVEMTVPGPECHAPHPFSF